MLLKIYSRTPVSRHRLIPTPRYYKQFALSLGKALPHIFSKFKSLDMDTFNGPSVSIL